MLPFQQGIKCKEYVPLFYLTMLPTIDLMNESIFLIFKWMWTYDTFPIVRANSIVSIPDPNLNTQNIPMS